MRAARIELSPAIIGRRRRRAQREQKRPGATCGRPAGASHIASMVEYLDGPRVKNEPELDADEETF